MTAKASKDVHPLFDFLAGTIGGMAGLVIGHPLDTVKVRFQTSGTANSYNSIANTLRTIIRNEGTRGLFKGITSPLAGTAFMNGLVFGSYGFILRYLNKISSSDPSLFEPSLWKVALAGSGSGVFASIVTTPTDLVKIRQQITTSRSGVPSTTQVVFSILRDQGIRGLYRGLTVTCLRDIGFGVYFATYEGTCRAFRHLRRTSSNSHPHQSAHVDHASLIEEAIIFEDQLSAIELMIAGGLAGTMSWLSTFPLDTVKSRIQSTKWVDPSHPGFSTTNSPYNNTWAALRYSYNLLGVRGLFAGLSPTLARAVPVNMVTFITFETIMGLIKV